MNLLEQKIRRYEHMRWAQEPNRRTLPFAWGLEHIGGDAKEADPRGFLSRLFWALSGGYRYLDIWEHGSDGNGYLDVLPESPPLPWPWLSAAELAPTLKCARELG